MKWQTNHASQSGQVFAPDDAFMPFATTLAYNTSGAGPVYRVESPDAIEPVDENGQTLLRYGDNNTSAAVGTRGHSSVVVFGFPFETVTSSDERERLMQAVLYYLENQ